MSYAKKSFSATQPYDWKIVLGHRELQNHHSPVPHLCERPDCWLSCWAHSRHPSNASRKSSADRLLPDAAFSWFQLLLWPEQPAAPSEGGIHRQPTSFIIIVSEVRFPSVFLTRLIQRMVLISKRAERQAVLGERGEEEGSWQISCPDQQALNLGREPGGAGIFDS